MRSGRLFFAVLLFVPGSLLAALHSDFFDPGVSDAAVATALAAEPGKPLETLAGLRPVELSKKLVAQGKIDCFDYQLPGCDFTFGLNYYIPQSVNLKSPSRLAPVLLFLHGGGQSTQTYPAARAAAQMYMKSFTDYAEKNGTVLLFPSSALGWGLHTSFVVREALLIGRRELPVDSNRVVISGHSMGAMAISRNYQFFPDQAAGYLAQSGMIVEGGSTPEQIKTNYNAPFIYINGDDDHFKGFKPAMETYAKKVAELEAERKSKTRFEMIFRPGGHNYDLKQTYEKLDILFSKPRDLYQKDLYGAFFALDYAGDPKHVPPLPAYSRAIVDRYFWMKLLDYPASIPASKGAYFEAHIAGNTIAVRTVRNDIAARKMRLYLHSSMLDLGKPVTVTVDEKQVFSGMVATGVEQSVRIAREVRDPGFVFDGSVDVELVGKP